MYRVNVLYGEPSDPDHFTEYYRDTHLPIAAKIPGALNPTFAINVTADGPAPFWAIFSADFASSEAFAAGMGSQEGQAAAADIANYATGGATIVHYVVREP
ncbi:EthD family reductase [Gordonia sp. HY002]|uniref:EthD family reductase n=1 Tax=Gordonia zhenghanii TaxID=2911516 RepID=UPI001EEF9114|nr:EthD family reductase [Gordonia zhenghanii]MCF8572290.1 EthD family reductase [Gordonia zhenghanii]MCF8606003.1 EthD family reductase [Gordonia zhenghanii]